MSHQCAMKHVNNKRKYNKSSYKPKQKVVEVGIKKSLCILRKDRIQNKIKKQQMSIDDITRGIQQKQLRQYGNVQVMTGT